MKKALTMFAVVAIAAVASVSASAAVNHPIGVAVKGPIVATPTGNGGPFGLTITSVSVGTSGATPCYNCAGEGYVDLPWLQDVIPAGSAMTSTVQMQDFGYTGAPAVFYSVMQNGKVISQTEVVFPFTLSPGEEALAYFPDTAPATTGQTEIIATVYSGQTLVATSVYYISID
jgi:hypothetical protein